MKPVLDQSGEASRTDWFALHDPPTPDDYEDWARHDSQDALFSLGAYDDDSG